MIKRQQLDSTLHCRLPQRELENLQQLAAALDLTASQIARRALRETLRVISFVAD